MTQNIPTIGIKIKPRHYKKLMNNVWNERLLPSKLVIDGNEYEGGIPIGEITSDVSKKIVSN